MKNLIYLLLFVTLGCAFSEQKEVKIDITNEETVSSDRNTAINDYDSTLAKKFGADDYGMKPYVMAFLKTGPNPAKDSMHAIEMQAAHMANIGRLAEEGKLVLAGPFYGDDKGDFRGIYIFNTSSIDSARAYTASDPAVQYGIFVMDLKNYYGSAALMGINETHKKIAKIEI